jgi:phosphoglycolate phosphatase-like HAD superfamily hydrolase
MEWDGLELKDGLRLLENCYNRLAQAVKDDQADPKEITSLVEEAEQIVVLLDAILQRTPLEEEKEQTIQTVKEKADAIIQLLNEEMGAIAEQYAQIKTGRQAIDAYYPQPVGLGYSEGKFVDRKE